MKEEDKIIFEWDGQDYTVPKAANPIILPNMYVLWADDWVNKSFHSSPKKLTLLFKIHCISHGLAHIANKLGGVYATAVTIKTNNICPKGCKRPGQPFCCKCGSPVEVTLIVSPKNRT